MTEFDERIIKDLEVMKWVVLRDGFKGFSQTHELECDPPTSKNSCRISVSIMSPELNKGSINLLKRGRKCRNCPVEKLAKELDIVFKHHKTPNTD